MKSSTSRYVAIAEHIRRRITSGQLPPGTRLPSQRELAEQYHTTLMTIRQALNFLAELNLLSIEHGVGTFVAQPNLDEDTLHLLSFSDIMRQRAVPVETRLLRAELEVSHASATHIFSLPSATPVCLVERLRLIDDKPVVHQRSYLPPWLSAVVRNYSPASPLYEQLLAQTGQMVTMSREVLRPAILAPEEAQSLQRRVGEPVFQSLRVSTNADDVPLVYDEAILAGDRFALATQYLGRQSTSSLLVLAEDPVDLLDLLLKNE